MPRTPHRPEPDRAAPPRVVVDAVRPSVDGGRFPVKRVVGEELVVSADVFADGHDAVAAALALRPAGGTRWTIVPMSDVGNDRWEATVVPQQIGDHEVRVVGWVDHVATWRRGLLAKQGAGQDTWAELAIGAALLEQLDEPALRAAAARLGNGDPRPATGNADGEGDALEAAARTVVAERCVDDGEAARTHGVAWSPTLPLVVDRPRARFSSWYELFPRSLGPDEQTHGTFADVARLVPEIAEMGFDVLYLPPIHPIGTTKRKGRNNTEDADPGEPGSPWGIGGPEGGHTAVHPELGTLDDLRSLRDTCGAHGLELALDVAFQCSPDHPWVSEHPAWFRHRPDGTIQYAENPPKRYQDIYPLDFESADWPALWEGLLGVFRMWLGEGIRIFRVDNPHTKAFAFWEWCLAHIRAEHPDALFLAEAFTRPKVMHRLAKLGFTQSYTYFTWRVSKDELERYALELSDPGFVDRGEGVEAGVEYFRPNLWPNTPDILPFHLQGAPREAFALRAVLAATMSASWGVYGPAFELGENCPVAEGREEYLDSEKYQLRRWDRSDPTSLRWLLTELNAIRQESPALQQNRTLHVHRTSDEHLVAYSKAAPAPSPDVVLTVVNLDPHHPRAGTTDLDLWALRIDPGRPFLVHDLLGGETYRWEGPWNYVELHPARMPAHVFRIEQP